MDVKFFVIERKKKRKRRTILCVIRINVHILGLLLLIRLKQRVSLFIFVLFMILSIFTAFTTSLLLCVTLSALQLHKVYYGNIFEFFFPKKKKNYRILILYTCDSQIRIWLFQIKKKKKENKMRNQFTFFCFLRKNVM